MESPPSVRAGTARSRHVRRDRAWSTPGAVCTAGTSWPRRCGRRRRRSTDASSTRILCAPTSSVGAIRCEPVRYEVDRIRNGRSFVTRRVVARQAIGAILNLEASFQVDEAARRSTLVTPRPGSAAPRTGPTMRGAAVRATIRRHGHVEPVRAERDGPDRCWLKVVDDLGDDRLLQCCALAYLSDDLPTDSVRARWSRGSVPEHRRRRSEPRSHDLVPPPGAGRPLAPARLQLPELSWGTGAWPSATSSARTAPTWPPSPRRRCSADRGRREPPV